MKSRPRHDRISVRRAQEKGRSAGGIVIPGSAAETPIRGEAVAAGNGEIPDRGGVRFFDRQGGDRIRFGKHAGTKVRGDDEELLVMREDHTMGVIEKQFVTLRR